MKGHAVQASDQVVIDVDGLQRLLDLLAAKGYRTLGPRPGNGAVIYDDIAAVTDLPAGCGSVQEPGRYRLVERGDGALFAYGVSPHSWKRFLHPPQVRLWRAERENGTLRLVAEPEAQPKMAFIGVRPCELQAIAILDRVFLNGPYTDPGYHARREHLFLVAVNCTEPGGTCFCGSMGTGPAASSGFDLALTEMLDAGRHVFLVQAGSKLGSRMLRDIGGMPATDADRAAAERLTMEATAKMGRSLDVDGLPQILERSYGHARWDDVAKRCLTCANCTMACPTCFCSTVEDTSDLTGRSAERWRKWDSCFSVDFSYIHGGSLRPSAMSRYRQWLTHKFGTWNGQFGTSGCVGCGRCITWCPVGIDVTVEAGAIREERRSDHASLS
jgi:ferredoxin